MPSCGVSPASMKPVISAYILCGQAALRASRIWPSVLDHRGQHRRRVVPVRPAAGRAAQALLGAAVLRERDQRERRGALRAEPGFRSSRRKYAGRQVAVAAVAHHEDDRRVLHRLRDLQRHPAARPPPRCRRRCPPRAPGAGTSPRRRPGSRRPVRPPRSGRRSSAGIPAATCGCRGCASLRSAGRRRSGPPGFLLQEARNAGDGAGGAHRADEVRDAAPVSLQSSGPVVS